MLKLPCWKVSGIIGCDGVILLLGLYRRHIFNCGGDNVFSMFGGPIYRQFWLNKLLLMCNRHLHNVFRNDSLY